MIIGAWNFPIQLLLVPLVGALAAGNTVVLKPSDLAKNVEALVAKLVPKYLDPKVVRVVVADGPGTRYSRCPLMSSPFGSVKVQMIHKQLIYHP